MFDTTQTKVEGLEKKYLIENMRTRVSISIY